MRIHSSVLLFLALLPPSFSAFSAEIKDDPLYMERVRVTKTFSDLLRVTPKEGRINLVFMKSNVAEAFFEGICYKDLKRNGETMRVYQGGYIVYLSEEALIVDKEKEFPEISAGLLAHELGHFLLEPKEPRCLSKDEKKPTLESLALRRAGELAADKKGAWILNRLGLSGTEIMERTLRTLCETKARPFCFGNSDTHPTLPERLENIRE